MTGVADVAGRQDHARAHARNGRDALRRLEHRAYAQRRLIAFALTLLGVLAWAAFVLWIPADTASDAHAYFVGRYGGTLGGDDAYLYAPAFSQLVEPLRWLGWDGFRQVWRGLEVGALALMAGSFTGLLLFVRPVAIEVNIGNIHALLGLAIVAGFRWPWTWAFVLLTKVTPGVGLLWFVVRREWRKAAIAFGATAAIVVVSFALSPGDWFAWFRVLTAPPVEAAQPIITLPLVPRLGLAALLVAWGASRDKRWTVLVAAFLALPSVWETGLAMLVGLWALRFSAGRLGDHAPVEQGRAKEVDAAWRTRLDHAELPRVVR